MRWTYLVGVLGGLFPVVGGDRFRLGFLGCLEVKRKGVLHKNRFVMFGTGQADFGEEALAMCINGNLSLKPIQMVLSTVEHPLLCEATLRTASLTKKYICRIEGIGKVTEIDPFFFVRRLGNLNRKILSL